MAENSISELKKIRSILERQYGEADTGPSDDASNAQEELKKEVNASGEGVKQAVETSGFRNLAGLKNIGNLFKDFNITLPEFLTNGFNKLSSVFEKFSFSMPEFIREGFQKFLGLDFKEKFFRALDVLRDLPNTIGNLLNKIPGVGAIGDGLSSFFDVLKGAAALAAGVIGLQAFLDGYDQAEKWFGKNPDFWDRLSSGLANIAASFFGLDENETKNLAMKIRKGLQYVQDFFQYLIDDVFAVVKDVWGRITPIGDSIKQIMAGDIKGGFSNLFEQLKGIGKSLLDNEGALIAIAILLGPSRILGVLNSLLGGAVSLIKGITNITTKIVATAFKLGVGAVKVLAKLALAAGNLILNTGKFAAGLASSAAKMRLDTSLPKTFLGKAGLVGLALSLVGAAVSGIGDGIEEYKKSGSLAGALAEGIKGFGLQLASILTLGFFSKEEIEKGLQNLFKSGFSLVDEVLGMFDGLISGVKGFVNMLVEKVNSVIPDRFAIDPPFPEANVQQTGGFTHNSLLKSIVDNDDLTRAEKQKAFDEINASQNRGETVNQMVANTNNQVIQNAFTASPGGGAKFATN